jgi:hypothetical protein
MVSYIVQQETGPLYYLKSFFLFLASTWKLEFDFHLNYCRLNPGRAENLVFNSPCYVTVSSQHSLGILMVSNFSMI